MSPARNTPANRKNTISSRARASLGRKERLRRSSDFGAVYTQGHRLTGPHLCMYFKPNQLRFNRLGLSITKRRFKLSTTRHAIQRRLREAYRLNKIRFAPGYDLIISAQRFNDNKIRFKEIESELLLLARRARLLRRT